jgi:UDP-glucose 4-epimerase
VRIVVTGGAGFIGANLVRELLDAGIAERIVVVDDLSTGLRANVPEHPSVEVVECSILSEDALDAACEGADAIVHLAAVPSVPRSLVDPLRSHHANATGTVHVLEVARRLGAYVVVASSSSVYGANPVLPKHEELATRPLSPYAASKLATEAYALAYASSFGLDVLAFRFFNVYGPLQAAGHAYAAVVPAFVSAALAGEELTVYGDGLQTRDFTFVGTVTRILAAAVQGRVTSEIPLNLAFGSRTSLLELIAQLEAVVGHPVERRHLEARAGDVRDSQADNTALRERFPGVEPVPLAEGLHRTVEWMRTADVSG